MATEWRVGNDAVIQNGRDVRFMCYAKLSLPLCHKDFKTSQRQDIAEDKKL
jgi:hypothetical protein